MYFWIPQGRSTVKCVKKIKGKKGGPDRYELIVNLDLVSIYPEITLKVYCFSLVCTYILYLFTLYVQCFMHIPGMKNKNLSFQLYLTMMVHTKRGQGLTTIMVKIIPLFVLASIQSGILQNVLKRKFLSSAPIQELSKIGCQADFMYKNKMQGQFEKKIEIDQLFLHTRGFLTKNRSPDKEWQFD